MRKIIYVIMSILLAVLSFNSFASDKVVAKDAQIQQKDHYLILKSNKDSATNSTRPSHLSHHSHNSHYSHVSHMSHFSAMLESGKPMPGKSMTDPKDQK